MLRMLSGVKRLARRIPNNRLPGVLIGAGIFYFLFLFRLGSLTAGLSSRESLAAAGSNSISAIANNPFYGPHKLLQLGLRSLFSPTAADLRLVSAIFVAVFLICFYLLATRWFGRLIGGVSAIMLATTPWVMLLGRSATPLIMPLMPVVLATCYYWFVRSQKHFKPAWLLFCFCLAALLYIPGTIWLLLVGLIINRRTLRMSLSRLNFWWLMAGVLIFAAIMAPLVRALVKMSSLIHTGLLWPAKLADFSDLIRHTGWMAASLFVRTPGQIEWLVGRLPILSIMASALVVFGAYAMSQQARQKLYMILGVVVFGWLAASINNDYSYLTFCLVPLFILTAAGLRFLFLQWQSVFPRNPIPRHFAYAIIIALAVIQAIYGFRTTLYAWPNTRETTSTFVLK